MPRGNGSISIRLLLHFLNLTALVQSAKSVCIMFCAQAGTRLQERGLVCDIFVTCVFWAERPLLHTTFLEGSFGDISLLMKQAETLADLA
ncbi:hypothetical protein BJ165DRAFT_1509966 [Panaeolus papilionaceus]|nr:hypothetical protein BJ165DRAFT_1509966 [Panaeolus papilionaceus]